MPLKSKLAVAFCAASAAAGLAEDRAAGGGTPGAWPDRGTTAVEAYTRLKRTLPSGTTVTQYTDAQGAVFAVSWSGPFLPDLQALLGPHFALFADQQRRATSLHAPVVVRSDDVVIVAGGSMGAFEGQAWFPPRVPAGFDPRVLR